MLKKPKPRTLIGVVHLPALPGAPMAASSAKQTLRQAVSRAVKEAKTFEQFGFDGLILENFGDVPFFKSAVPPITIAAMSVIASEVRAVVGLRLGINVLRNDARAALSIAAITGCQFIRTNVLSGVAATDQGLIEGDAASLVRERSSHELQGSSIEIWADALVKHAQSISVSDLSLAVEELAQRSLADAVILTGPTTGRPIDLKKLEEFAVKKSHVPIFLGSGVNSENVHALLPKVSGAIIGSALRKEGRAGAELDLGRVKKLVRAFRDVD
ncbi:MAG: BtpA/SgcQ family protein [Bdellovibrionota bacterium]